MKKVLTFRFSSPIMAFIDDEGVRNRFFCFWRFFYCRGKRHFRKGNYSKVQDGE